MLSTFWTIMNKHAQTLCAILMQKEKMNIDNFKYSIKVQRKKRNPQGYNNISH